MYPDLDLYIEGVKKEISEISDHRKVKLQELADYIEAKKNTGEPARLVFICTHNSRRSHFCQIWSAVFAEYFGIAGVETFSGGTEVTAFNPRAVGAIERTGLKVRKPKGENPRYEVWFDDGEEPLVCFSKTFADPYNPKNNFAAVMTCSDADENCPVIFGAEKRFSIPYVDPKESDGTSREKATYDERCRQVASEMCYLMSEV
ncbi:protein-tyrosine-phosphatase [Fodinibius sediminis]|uniref:Protein-tyrosine phosphatase/arsenate reductase n=1 Tax=Fodinibius sediminis TaxID=1214077 RepID=A0A521B8Z8_9BACT|nr:protein-tyrosine-phosphatase [Fodinibius sediminis]SMO43557.1 protein-tyrosine phosphatase/arsenate reductase [Fodinibius sediminis]